jgi:hypothetical protein
MHRHPLVFDEKNGRVPTTNCWIGFKAIRSGALPRGCGIDRRKRWNGDSLRFLSLLADLPRPRCWEFWP